MHLNLCRICDNNLGWTRPVGSAIEGPQSHFGCFGFTTEERNRDNTCLIDGWKYGWIEGFYTETDPQTGQSKAKPFRPVVPFEKVQVVLYAKRGKQKVFVGYIKDCEHILQTDCISLFPTVHIARMAAEAKQAGADIREVAPGYWQVFRSMRGRAGSRAASIPRLTSCSGPKTSSWLTRSKPPFHTSATGRWMSTACQSGGRCGKDCRGYRSWWCEGCFSKGG